MIRPSRSIRLLIGASLSSDRRVTLKIELQSDEAETAKALADANAFAAELRATAA